MFKLMWVAFCTSLFISIPAQASDARAKWVDATHVKLKLPPGFFVSSSVQFFFMDGASSLSSSAVALPLISVENSIAWLSTAQLSKADIDRLIQKPLKVVISNNNHTLLDSTSVQLAGVLDQLYYYDQNDLGGLCDDNQCSLKIWAPTAQNVRVHLFRQSSDSLSQDETLQANRTAQGVWSLNLSSAYENYFYLYEVTAYQPLLNRIETGLVTDPYSKSLSLNSEKSQLVNLSSNRITPAGWNSLAKPYLNSLNDSTIYELHIRDFSANDNSVAATYRGTYLAFTLQDSFGIRHLRGLADAGLTHLHLLPFHDFGSVNEKKSEWESYAGPSKDLQEPQSIIGGMRDNDAFNWGYDPVHYFAPEGSYAVNGDGAQRIYEVRSMVQAINGLGLRVVQDVVFNHTYQAGLEPYSVFDKIVPLYYYRLDDNGNIQKTSCCNDTAVENRMMEKLMIDSVVYWAKTYKLDGFRFDLMSFHTRQTMERLRQALRSLTLDQDGIEGSKLLLYGEGWSFGSLVNRQPKEAMTIENSYGTHYGFFNDRLRDAVRGGTTSSTEKSDQGFATGLYFDFNQEPANRNTPIALDQQRDKILHLGDVIKAGLAGNLKNYYFREHLGNLIPAGDLKFRNSPVGVASEALETINYVSAHDGYGLWDAIQAKAPFYNSDRSPVFCSIEDRLRMYQLALAIPFLGQGIPFVEAGTDLLRSKNGDQDSYDSGDFFNRIDWTGTSNYWGAGLPPAWRNIDDWSFWRPRLQASDMRISPKHIEQAKNYFKALLQLRRSSNLFKLNSLENITEGLHFIDNDQQPEPGLVTMLLQNQQESLLIFFNASRESRFFSHLVLRQHWTLHPLFNEKVDPALSQVMLDPSSGKIQIPGRTTVVLKLFSQDFK
ncbi:MAG: alpha-1,6-glucosidase domain-containing protein [Pseudobdellovibrionaceae bacterium]